jgi:4-amino-4-deoxy-L-arabinose transferase-like glycosyltransferase
MKNPAAFSSSIDHANQARFVNHSRILPWVGLICILATYAYGVARIHPTNFFGLMEDDSIYFSSAREIAQGRGYVLPNIPGTPPATKYPILYPWILSWVWRWNPTFPGNLVFAVALNVAFGMAYLTSAFIFLRKLKGLGDTAALVLTAFCAVHPVVIALSAYLMSDIPFAAFTLASCLLASKAIESGAEEKNTIFCGILSGFSLLLRTLGITVAFGLFLAIALRSGWRKSIVFAGSILPFLLVFFARSFLIKPAPLPLVDASCSDSWRMTWLYYTSYGGYWKSDILANHVSWEVLKNGIWNALIQPASYFVDFAGMRPALLAVVLLVFLSAVAIRGLARQVQVGGWQPMHFAMGFYLVPLLVWDYANFERFLIPFLPLIAAGMWVEGQHLVYQVRSSTNRKNGTEEKVAAFFFCLIGCALLFGTTYSWWRGTALLARNSQFRSELLNEKRQAYAWLRNNSSPDAKVLAYEDASSFLYSGRQTLRPTIFSPAGYYRPEILDAEISCITSSAKPIGATFWLVADDDFRVEWEPAYSRARSKEREIEVSLRPLFRTTQGRVRIYKLNLDDQSSR